VTLIFEKRTWQYFMFILQPCKLVLV